MAEMLNENVPALKHGDKIVKGATDCIEYIDKTFGPDEVFYPKGPIFIQITSYVF